MVLRRVTNSANTTDVAWLKSWMLRELPEFLTRDVDRLLLADLFTPAPPSTTDAGRDAASVAPGKAERCLVPA